MGLTIIVLNLYDLLEIQKVIALQKVRYLEECLKWKKKCFCPYNESEWGPKQQQMRFYFSKSLFVFWRKKEIKSYKFGTNFSLFIYFCFGRL